MAVEHFDEGVYASNLYCGHLDPAYAYPDRALYAPPFVPAVLEWTLLLSGDPHSVEWVNVVVGTLMILAVWWVGRAWFGSATGLAAAVLAATSDYHIAFSRMALTDVPLCLWMLLGVYAGWRAVLSGRPLWIGAAGLLAGLAWCTKYNGWLTLAVTGSGTIAWLVCSPPGNVRWWWEALTRWMATAVVAAIFFWIVAVRPLGEGGGGYAAVAANHAKYFVGLGGCWDGLLRQLDAHAHINGWVACSGIAVWGCVTFLSQMERSRMESPRRWPAAVLVGLMLGSWAIGAGATVLVLMFATLGLASEIRASRAVNGADASGSQGARSLALWLCAAWLGGLLVATPLYYPYPRLSLPLLSVCWLGASVALVAVIKRAGIRGTEESDLAPAARPWSRTVLAALAAAVLLAAIGIGYASAARHGPPFFPARFPAWEDRSLLATGAGRALSAVEADLQQLPASRDPDLDAVIYVYADPAAFFHLAADAAERAPRVLVHPAGNLGMTEPGATRRPVAGVYLVTGSRAHRDEAALEAVRDRLQLIGRYAYRASDLVLLDEYPPEALREQAALRDEELRLYRVVAD
jgi:4-amino-4-deoxy-L-arabinose transferase-like glycosyltransferase